MTDERLTDLPKALAEFQSAHHAAGKDGKGNYGTYTTLAGALAAVQPATAFGLSHTQILEPINDEFMVLRTMLMHTSGETLSSDLPIPIRYEGGRTTPMQAMGGAITYARRYGLLAIYGLAGDDDDGETAVPAPRQQRNAPPARRSNGSDGRSSRDELQSAAIRKMKEVGVTPAGLKAMLVDVGGEDCKDIGQLADVVLIRLAKNGAKPETVQRWNDAEKPMIANAVTVRRIDPVPAAAPEPDNAEVIEDDEPMLWAGG
jgi:hypothetical protein